MGTSSLRVPGDAEAGPRLEPSTHAGTPGGRRARPIDLVHLSRQTFGDKRLETELLRLFMRQSEQILASLDPDEAHPEPRDAGDLLHLLLGSARAVGATAVADVAEQLETEQRRLGDGAALSGDERAALRDAVTLTNRFISGLLERS